MSKVLVPPIKCQGIKTKIVPLIMANSVIPKGGRWIEPFMGSGVVGMNARPSRAVFSDINPHLVNFYDALKQKRITPASAKVFLENEGCLLGKKGEDHYYEVRDRFNGNGDPLDFLFLSRSCFNGMIRFNKKGGFNVPFCRKPARFTKGYITKIINQMSCFCELVRHNDWVFLVQDFEAAIASASADDFLYCDPPYFGRHADYFNSWDIEDEKRLCACLSGTAAKFILSTWHSNMHRKNQSIDLFWSRFHTITQEHFYHVGAREDNRSPMLEALVMNFQPACAGIARGRAVQRSLFTERGFSEKAVGL